jgi:uncharacterized protein YaeQ
MAIADDTGDYARHFANHPGPQSRPPIHFNAPQKCRSRITMALKATIFKADIQIADMDRHYYADHTLTIARHPSETDERMMMRLLAFALHANEALVFGKGLSADDEPDLWHKDLTGAIEHWIDVGQPDEKSLMKACGRAGHVTVYGYGSASGVWWSQVEGKLARARNLSVRNVPSEASLALAKLAQRTMRLQCTIQDGVVWFSEGDATVQLEPVVWKSPQ